MNEFDIPDPITPEDLPFLPDPDDLEPAELRLLLERLGVLYDHLCAEEPVWPENEEDPETEVCREWAEQLEELDDLMDDIRDRLEE